jgi:hypothetical protein
MYSAQLAPQPTLRQTTQIVHIMHAFDSLVVFLRAQNALKKVFFGEKRSVQIETLFLEGRDQLLHVRTCFLLLPKFSEKQKKDDECENVMKCVENKLRTFFAISFLCARRSV